MQSGGEGGLPEIEPPAINHLLSKLFDTELRYHKISRKCYFLIELEKILGQRRIYAEPLRL